jgi:signal transduction histidine kinase
VTEVGLPVELRIEGTPHPLPATVDLSAYRVAQEALTNTLQHAGPARASVTVRYGPDTLEVTVVDDGAGPLWTTAGAPTSVGLRSPTGGPGVGPGGPRAAPGPGGGGAAATTTTGWDGAARDPGGSGHGLVGMRERVSLFGGELRAGPGPEGGFAVTARFPLPSGQG